MTHSGQHLVGVVEVFEQNSDVGLVCSPGLPKSPLNALHVAEGRDQELDRQFHRVIEGRRKAGSRNMSFLNKNAPSWSYRE